MRILLAVLLASSTASTIYRAAPPPPVVPAPAPILGPLCEPIEAPDTAAVFVKKVVEDFAVIRFEADVNQSNVSRFMYILEDAPKIAFKYLVVELKTPGGNVQEGMRMAEAIEHSHLPVYCVADQWVASMGFYILQACAHRMMVRDGALLVHEPYKKVLFGVNRFGLKAAVADLDPLAEKMLDYEARRLTVPRAQLAARLAGPDAEWRMTADEALRVGAVDEVIESLDAATSSRPPARPSR
jgi:ATP-dependent protease ClpP protease subunit